MTDLITPMKTIALLCLLASASLAQTPTLQIDTASRAVYYQQRMRLDSSLDNHAVLRHALSWLGRAYRQSDPVVERYDPVQGIMIAKAQFFLSPAQAGKKRFPYTAQLIPHLVIVDTHPGQCQLTLTGFDQQAAQQLRSPEQGSALKQRCVEVLESFRGQWSDRRQ